MDALKTSPSGPLNEVQQEAEAAIEYIAPKDPFKVEPKEEKKTKIVDSIFDEVPNKKNVMTAEQIEEK